MFGYLNCFGVIDASFFSPSLNMDDANIAVIVFHNGTSRTKRDMSEKTLPGLCSPLSLDHQDSPMLVLLVLPLYTPFSKLYISNNSGCLRLIALDTNLSLCCGRHI